MEGKTFGDLLNESLGSLQKYENVKEQRLLTKPIAQLTNLRKSFTTGPVPCLLSESSPLRGLIESHLPAGTFVFQQQNKNENDAIQIECFYSILAGSLALNSASSSSSRQTLESFAQFTTKALEYFFFTVNARFLDVMLAKLCFIHGRFCELLGILNQARPFQLSLLRVTTLHRDIECELMLIQLILRSYLHCNLYDVADKFASKVFATPASLAQQHYRSGTANASFVKMLFYVGKIEAVKLNYTKAYEYLQLALRKAPSTASGFQQSCAKLLIIVQLLMGDLPEKSLFTEHSGMQPYVTISQSVHQGNTELFQSILTNQPAIVEKLERDGTLSLVLRLRHNVIKAAVKRANIAYSHITLADLGARIFPKALAPGEGVSSGDGGMEAEFVALKCIKDGVVDAYVTHQSDNSSGACFHSKDLLNVYGTAEASMSIGRRVEFCLRTRREAMKAMRYDQPIEKKSTTATDATNGTVTDSGADNNFEDGGGAIDMMDDEMDF